MAENEPIALNHRYFTEPSVFGYISSWMMRYPYGVLTDFSMFVVVRKVRRVFKQKIEKLSCISFTPKRENKMNVKMLS